jgi:hypothetical protein
MTDAGAVERPEGTMLPGRIGANEPRALAQERVGELVGPDQNFEKPPTASRSEKRSNAVTFLQLMLLSAL